MGYQVILGDKPHNKILTYDEAMALKEKLEKMFPDLTVEVVEV